MVVATALCCRVYWQWRITLQICKLGLWILEHPCSIVRGYDNVRVTLSRCDYWDMRSIMKYIIYGIRSVYLVSSCNMYYMLCIR